MEILRLENITFAYSGEGSLALDHVSLSIESGKYYSIIGHNGSGKSTLAKLIMGLLSPKEGNIVIFGEIDLLSKCIGKSNKGVFTILEEGFGNKILQMVKELKGANK